MFDSGLRKAEARRCSVEHVDLDRAGQLDVDGKGGKTGGSCRSMSRRGAFNDLAILEGLNRGDYLWYSAEPVRRAGSTATGRSAAAPSTTGTGAASKPPASGTLNPHMHPAHLRHPLPPSPGSARSKSGSTCWATSPSQTTPRSTGTCRHGRHCASEFGADLPERDARKQIFAECRSSRKQLICRSFLSGSKALAALWALRCKLPGASDNPSQHRGSGCEARPGPVHRRLRHPRRDPVHGRRRRPRPSASPQPRPGGPVRAGDHPKRVGSAGAGLAEGLGRAPNLEPAEAVAVPAAAGSLGAGARRRPSRRHGRAHTAPACTATASPAVGGCGRRHIAVAHRTLSCGTPLRVCWRNRCHACSCATEARSCAGRSLDLTEAAVRRFGVRQRPPLGRPLRRMEGDP